MEVEAAVIGGGVVGLACASALARAGKNPVLLERQPRVGTETSSRSSEVVHAGLYYAPGSLKATTCIRGAALLYAWCASHDVPHARSGKLLVAVDEEERTALDALARNAEQNGASVERIDGARVRALEPNVRAAAGLWSPNTGIVDSHSLCATLAADVAAHGGIVAKARSVIAVERTRDRWTLVCDGPAGRERVEAATVVNAAGLWADEVAAMFGVDVDARAMRQRFVKGNYFRVSRPLVKHLVYPMPPKDGASLGIHATIDLAGSVRLGPDTEPTASRADYAVDESRAAAFFVAATRYLVGLRKDDLAPDTSGIRPKVSGGDFMIERIDDVIHLVGIESPGLTAALALAERAIMMTR